MSHTTIVTKEQIAHQYEMMQAVKELLREHPLTACTHTFGCQQNEADTERIRGMLQQMGFRFTEENEKADFILFNTCAVREHAESRAFGNIGALAHQKKERPLLIAVCGCMVQQQQNADKIRKSYPQVDLVFGTHALWRFPALLFEVLSQHHRLFDLNGSEQSEIAEDLPVLRKEGAKAWLSIMYGCNNFCTYCIVPYVRGRERSRHPDKVESELRTLVQEGYRDITLLGQNVNSYGKDLGLSVDFSDLLRRLNAVPGDFRLRFMTSHPKDASERLFSTMAECEKVAKQLHLPFQSGSDRILQRMNRGYTAESYRALIADARQKMPDITLSSDIIVGFPGETEDDFLQTLQLVQQTGFDVLYTFLYSKRSGTPAAEFDDPATPQDKQARFQRLLNAQDEIVKKKQQAYLGKKVRVLIDGISRDATYRFMARTDGNLLVCCTGDRLKIGDFEEVTIVKTTLRCLFGEQS